MLRGCLIGRPRGIRAVQFKCPNVFCSDLAHDGRRR